MLNELELGMILPVGGYECQLISILDNRGDLEEPKPVALPQRPPSFAGHTLKRVITHVFRLLFLLVCLSSDIVVLKN